MYRSIVAFSLLLFASVATAGQVSITTDRESGVQIYTLTQGNTVVKVAPSHGANAYSLKINGTEYFRQPASLNDLFGTRYGNPILYPTPNRIRGAKFTFRQKTVSYTPNGRGNYIHGLVNQSSWDIVGTRAAAQQTSLRMLASFTAGTELHEKFPFPHKLYVTVTVKEGAVRWAYEVDNSNGSESVPFGFALHPYFLYQGKREETFLTIPATHLMQSEAQLPSGKLIPAKELDYQLGKPLSLKETNFDDVFWGMESTKPTIIEFRGVSKQVTLVTSPEFTHLVVWTPGRPYFGIENQTCSTDAHNLHSAGLVKESHLQICEPGEKMTGWVEYRFQ